jgi:hypothetical protein
LVVAGVEDGRGARLGRRLEAPQRARSNGGVGGRISGAQRQAGQKVAHP